MRASAGASERWFQRALWLVAVVFAGFLIGLGGLVVGDLPQVEQRAGIDRYLDKGRAEAAAEATRALRRAQDDAARRTEQAVLELEAARSASAAARETFANWLRTRDATQRVDQDPGLIERSARLDALKDAERAVETRLEGLRRDALDLAEREAEAQRADEALRAPALAKLERAQRRQELRVFAYRLALTLPLLVLAGWLLAKRRGGRNWPFVWGFAFFAAFAFFVELVPYLPSYGGYVLNGVGVIVTLVAGRWAIKAYGEHLARRREQEARPDEERRVAIATDAALARLAKKSCPGCERPLDLADPALNHCPHCGIGLFERCRECSHRKSTFDLYCAACGTPSGPAPAAPATA